MQPKGSLKTLILSEHRFLRSPENLTLRHSRRSRCSRLGQLSRMAFKPASVNLFAKSWRWLSLGIVSAIARASSSLSYGKRINLRRFSFSVRTGPKASEILLRVGSMRTRVLQAVEASQVLLQVHRLLFESTL